MRKKLTAFLLIILLLATYQTPAYAASIPRVETPDYKVAYYAYDCFNMQDENGKRYGYGYEMMQSISKHMQCTFSYVGYDKSAKECVEMLRNGELDIYTAARFTPEREEEFAFSKHPAITATTCMNIKVGNNKVVPGDYSTYDGMKIGLLRRHTYNDAFKEFAEEKGFSCEIIYYETPAELSDALVNEEVDALVNSYIRTPEDEYTIENFGSTPYYFMVRKEDRFLVDELDAAIDAMNIETPNWRTDLYNIYYGSPDSNTDLSDAERRFLSQMKTNNTVIRAVMNPDGSPYSWYEDGEAKGIAVDIFKATAQKLGLEYEVIPVSSREEYQEVLASGDVDIWLDMNEYYEDEGAYKYQITDPYLTTTVSVLRHRGSSGRMNHIAIIEDTIVTKELISGAWPYADVIILPSTKECVHQIIGEKIDGVLMMSYTAQELARSDVQNRLTADVVPGAFMNLCMGVNANDNRLFFNIWQKTLIEVSSQISDEIVQTYLQSYDSASFLTYLFDHPVYFVLVIAAVFLLLSLLFLYIQSVRTKNRQLQISNQLSAALEEARNANNAKLNFFSKMSHDIRTPLNVVLGMTQIAKKYKNEPAKLDNALDNITTEGAYLLAMINSILDINQLEHGHIELNEIPFRPEECMQESIDMLRPLAEKKEQKLEASCELRHHVVLGDSGRFSQIMVNIVSNAIKYTPAGGRIAVSLELLPDNRYRFTCTDNGIGMSEEFLKHICEDYSRAEDSRISSKEGTGLGMAVVKGFTDLMHGTLTIHSKLGEGSTFIVEIPFAEATKEQKKDLIQAVSQSQSGIRYDGKKVLLVEDNALNAEIAMELLQTIGFTVEWAENGKVGVEKFQQSEINEYYAIFMDMQMPVMDGVEATKCIRSCKRADRNIPVFAMTANTFASDRQVCMEAGMNGYISKPVNLKDMRKTLQMMC